MFGFGLAKLGARVRMEAVRVETVGVLSGAPVIGALYLARVTISSIEQSSFFLLDGATIVRLDG